MAIITQHQVKQASFGSGNDSWSYHCHSSIAQGQSGVPPLVLAGVGIGRPSQLAFQPHTGSTLTCLELWGVGISMDHGKSDRSPCH